MTFSDFSSWFARSEDKKNQFSYQALKKIFEYYEQYEEDTGEQIEFDPVAFCCEWSEFEDMEEVKKNYNDIETIMDLNDNTTAYELDNGHILLMSY